MYLKILSLSWEFLNYFPLETSVLIKDILVGLPLMLIVVAIWVSLFFFLKGLKLKGQTYRGLKMLPGFSGLH